MPIEPHVVDCGECDYSEAYPNRETAEHAKRVHETEYPGHAATVERE